MTAARARRDRLLVHLREEPFVFLMALRLD
jgi:hypothetical protein